MSDLASKAYVDSAPGDICQIKTGTYTGDGSEGQAITGVGFRPKYVSIWERPLSESGAQTHEKLDQAWADYSMQLVGALNSVDNAVNSLDADGFTVDDDGADYFPNRNGVAYDYLALG